MRAIPRPAILSALFVPVIAAAQGGSMGAQSPFTAPNAKIQYAPDRMYDLHNLRLEFNVDWPNRTVTALAVNTVSAIRDGVKQLRFHAAEHIKFDDVELDGRKAKYARDAEGILVDCPLTVAGAMHEVAFRYHFKKPVTGNNGGWHWHEPQKSDPARVGFWTNGETSDTRDWAVTWDYPNDFTASETKTTVPMDWEVISNGSLVSDTVDRGRKTRTVVWKMTQRHATYLTSVIAGPFDIKTDNWRGVPLYYVVPKGKGKYIDYSFGHTKDMLSFYSDNLGVKYPWPKYAQDCTYDFGGGQENVSATTLGEAFLTEPRAGWYDMDSLNSHEMGHQWFGDYVTCKDWGQIWLNESFATFMEMSYTLHSRGLNESQREIEQNSQGYFNESKRYKRPIATNFYSDPGVMFDQHTYPKGGALLLLLRKEMGEKPFYAGLHRYLVLHHNEPVETNDLCEAMTDATGINMHPWFDQWILKPGHPVIDWSWTWDDAKRQVMVHVKQTQDTSKGTPIYDVNSKVALLSKAGSIVRTPIRLNSADQTFAIAAPVKPDAVVFDADHDFMREIPKRPWSAAELPVVAQFAPDAVSRQHAFSDMLSGNPSEETVQLAADILRKDGDLFPAIVSAYQLAVLNKADLRSFWISQLDHKNFRRRTQAVSALASLPRDSVTTLRLKGMIDDSQPYSVVGAAIRGLGSLDYEASADLIVGQAGTAQNREIRVAALEAVLAHDQKTGTDLVFQCLAEGQPDPVRQAGMEALGRVKANDPRILAFVRQALQSQDFTSMFGAVQVAMARKLKEVIPDLENVKKKVPQAADFIDRAIVQIRGSK